MIPSAKFRVSLLLGLVLAILSIVAGAASAQQTEKESLFRGSDGQFDTSNFLAKRGGFLPVPIIITEPAVGYGGGLAAIFLHGGNPLAATAKPATSKRYAPPSMSMAGAFITENGSKGAVLGHMGVWKDDRIRYIGVAGAASLQLDYWGTPTRPVESPLQYDVEGALIIQRILFRIGDTSLMAGGEWSYSKQSSEFKSSVITPRTLDQSDSGVGAIAEYETLDNFFTPRKGMKARLLGKLFSESLGGDNDRETLDLEAFGYIPVHPRVTLGLRGDLALSDGDTPFYLLPYVKMRGLPALKYSAKHVASGELEARWNVHGRWSLVGFGGFGFAGDSMSDLTDSDAIGTAGAGFRYLLAERLGIHAGIDVARGPDDTAFYIVMGNAWR
jgi:hypothetical protein